MRPQLLLTIALLGCQDVGLQTSNARPTAEITVPRATSPVTEGVPLTLVGVAGDADHGATELRASWWVDAQQVCEPAPPTAEGDTRCTVTLDRGAHLVVLEVRDPTGQASTDEVALTVSPNEAPLAKLLRPLDGAAFTAGSPLSLEGEVSDAEDPVEALAVRWLSDRDGVLGASPPDAEGRVLERVSLQAGPHLLALEVTDTLGRVGRASAQIEVRATDDAPVCAILTPTTGSVFAEGRPVTLTATTTDDQTRYDRLLARWSSDLQGDLDQPGVSSAGQLSSVITDLLPGTHQLTLTVEDDVGQTCTDRVQLTVDTAPTVSLTAPLNGAVLRWNAPAALTGAVSDAEDDPSSLLLTARSDRDGPLTVGAPDGAGGFSASLTALTPGPHLLTVEVRDSAGLTGSQTVSLTVNQAPSSPTLTVSPAAPLTSDPLTASLLTPALDPEADPLTELWTWTRDGLPTGLSGPTVPASATHRGELWTVSLTVSDPWSSAPPASASVVIGNSPPSVSLATVSPTAPRVGEPLRCVAVGLTDPDGDPVSLETSWLVNGALTPGIDPLPTVSLRRGDAVRCTLTPTDGLDRGPSVSSAEVVLQNQLPSAAAAEISPEPLLADATARCRALGFTDGDGDPDLSEVQWTVDGAPAGTGATLSAPLTRGQTVGCVVVPFDGLERGTPVYSETTVQNSAPEADGATLTPAAPTAADQPRCALLGWRDVDGDPDRSTFTWTVNGAPAGSTPQLLRPLTRGDLLECVATPFDGALAGAPHRAAALVGNSPPSLQAARIDPPQPSADDPLRCAPVGAGDLDGDDVSLDYAWTRAGVTIAWGPVLPAGAAARGDQLTCTLTPSDGLDEGSPVTSAPVLVGNAAPSADAAVISPLPLRAGDAPVCDPVGFTDPDGDPDRSTRAWWHNGLAAGNTRQFSGSLVRGDTLRCELTPFDGLTAGATQTVSATVVNTPPTATLVSLTPPLPHASDLPRCEVLDYQDADGDPPQTRYAWTLNGQPAGVGPTLAAPLQRDDLLSCTATVSDGLDDGPTLTVTTLVHNAPPTLLTVDVLPLDPTTSDDLLCVPGLTTDPDGDPVSVLTAWEVDGVLLASTATLPAGLAARGALVRCLATPRDPYEDGLTLASAPVLIGNSPPELDAAVLTPDPARTADPLRCATLGFVDADGDPDQSTFRWFIDGTPAGNGPLLPTRARRGQLVRCEATAHDGRDAGPTATAELRIQNTAPTALSVRLTPADPRRDDVLSCALDGYSDADGDPDQTTWRWTRQGVEVGVGPTLTGPHLRGQRTQCHAQVHDGTDPGPLLSAEVTIQNSPPTVSVASLGPDPLFTEDTALATYTTEDADGDNVLVRLAWAVDGQPVGVTTSSLAGSWFSKGQSVTVSLTPDDGRDEGPTVVLGPLVVSNSPPRDLLVQISPADPLPWTPLRCEITQPAYDPDGDPVSYDASWIGPRGQVATHTTTHPDDTVPGHLVETGPWRCELRPTDADGLAGAPAVATTDVVGLWPDRLVSLSQADVQIYGEGLSDHLGDGNCPLATPDLDGDGRPDLALGVAELNLAAGNDAGGVRVFFGSRLRAGGTLPLSAADVHLQSDQGAALLGQCVLNAGDLDGDGRDELLVGAPLYDDPTVNTGRVWLFRGSDFVAGAVLTPAQAWRTWTGAAARADTGYALAAGDLDGGGAPELVIGAPHTTLSGVGAVYVLRGESLPASGPVATAATWTFTGAQVADRAGHQLAIGDLDGDGLSELIVGAPQATATAVQSGAVHLIDGATFASAGGAVSLTASRWRVTSLGPDDGVGARLTLTDLDGDGLADLFIGASELDGLGTDAGGALLLYGADLPTSGDLPLLDARTQLLGAVAGDLSGSGVSVLPDLDYDGLPELLIGAPGRALPDALTGEAALFSSRRLSWTSNFLFDEADHLFQGEDRLDRAGQQVYGAELNGDRRGDLLITAPYENRFWPSAGSVYLLFAP